MKPTLALPISLLTVLGIILPHADFQLMISTKVLTDAFNLFIMWIHDIVSTVLTRIRHSLPANKRKEKSSICKLRRSLFSSLIIKCITDC